MYTAVQTLTGIICATKEQKRKEGGRGGKIKKQVENPLALQALWSQT